MAVEIIRRLLCDVHLENDDDSREGITRLIQIDGESWELDACEECNVRIREFAMWVGKYGRTPSHGKRGRPAKAQNGAGMMQCPAKDCGYSTDAKPRLTAHARQGHGTTLLNLRGETSEFVCNQCQPPQFYEGNQGLTMHVNRVHSGVTVPDREAAAKPPAAPGRRSTRKRAESST